MRQAWGQSLNSLFDNHDILVTSTLRCLPPEKDAIQVTANGKTFAAHTAMTQLTMPFNLSGNPAITLPLPRFGNGLAAIQLIGRKGEDWRLLAVAKALEARLKD
jgi:aspartyl-tRNA(Asn)/glutamyl-tRNA(Gln) amidotransferase subunit A